MFLLRKYYLIIVLFEVNSLGDIIIDSKSGLMVNGDFTQQMQTKVQGMTINGRKDKRKS